MHGKRFNVGDVVVIKTLVNYDVIHHPKLKVGMEGQVVESYNIHSYVEFDGQNYPMENFQLKLRGE